MRQDELSVAAVEILETFGFISDSKSVSDIVPVPGGEWRKLFQYGDVLTVQKLHQLNPGVMKKMTHIGKTLDSKTLYTLLNNTCIKNHDYLHENIHRLQLIYKIYFDGFINACASVLGMKRVGIDPTKGRWKDHEDIVLKMLSALENLRFHHFLGQRGTPSNSHENKSDEEMLWNFNAEYIEYCESFVDCRNEVTRYISRFIEIANRWSMCKDAVRAGDWVVLEVESIDWLPAWVFLKKNLYLMETMRRIEVNNSLSPEELEYMRMSRLVRMHSNGNFISMDDFCEKQNYALKQCTNHADIEMMCKRSRHLHASSRCAKTIFGYEGKSVHHDIDITDDVRGLYQFFAKCHVFLDAPDANVALDSTTFSKEAVPLTFINSKQRKKIDGQRKKTFTSREKGLLSSFQGTENLITRDPNDESDDDDSDDGRDVARSGEDIVDVEVSSLDGNGSVDGVEETPIPNSKKRKKSKDGMKDIFSFDSVEVHLAVKKRLDKLKEEGDWMKTIYDCVGHFEEKMKKNMIILQERCIQRTVRINRLELPHETEVREAIEKYKVTQASNGIPIHLEST